MRRANLQMSTEAALALFAQAPYVHLCGAGASGQPIARVVHAVMASGQLCFHAAPAGEKLELLGRPVLASTEQVEAEIPSYSQDPERACPATTFYRSAQLRGRLERVDGEAARAEVMDLLMRRFQPEGGHAPLDPADAAWPRLYRKPVAGLWIVAITEARVTGKVKLGQTLAPAALCRILTTLWERGRPGVDAIVERLRAAHPERPVPAFLRAGEGFELCARPRDEEARGVAQALASEYWHAESTSETREAIAAAHRGSPAWVGVRDASGALVGSGRATSDGALYAMIHDVYLAPELRGRGLGRALMGLLLDHPAVRACRRTQLVTRDAARFYAGLGFEPQGDRYTRMARPLPGLPRG